jgi:hypothetical protein
MHEIFIARLPEARVWKSFQARFCAKRKIIARHLNDSLPHAGQKGDEMNSIFISISRLWRIAAWGKV